MILLLNVRYNNSTSLFLAGHVQNHVEILDYTAYDVNFKFKILDKIVDKMSKPVEIA